MSSESTVVYFGVRLEIPTDEIDGVEQRNHPLMIAAKTQGLDCYWGNFSSEGESYLLFIGTQLAILGLENDTAVEVSLETFYWQAAETRSKLDNIRIEQPPMLHMVWQPDF